MIDYGREQSPTPLLAALALVFAFAGLVALGPAWVGRPRRRAFGPVPRPWAPAGAAPRGPVASERCKYSEYFIYMNIK